MIYFKIYFVIIGFNTLIQSQHFTNGDQLNFSFKDTLKYRKEVKEMFYHAYDSYMKYAYPYDELRPLTCDGHDTWGSYSLTLIDALDTLAVMDNKTEFRKVVELISERTDFDVDINVSVFETNIRIVGGLISGHLLSRKMGISVEKGWPCEGPLLRLAADVASRLLPAFDTPTGMPYGTVNLRTGVPEGETPVTCAAGVGTFIMEFGTISRLIGNPLYEDVALRAIHYMWNRRSKLDLIGNHINVQTGLWTANDSGIGAGVDSFFEYLAKGSFLLQRPELMSIFKDARRAIDFHLRHEDWYLWKTMQRGQLTMAVFQSLEAFWPGILTLVGDLDSAKKTIFNYHQVLSQYGFHPEFYNIPQASAYVKRSGYPLRPEFVESLVYLYQATKDTIFLKMGADLVRSINHSARTPCGYATVDNVIDHSLDNRMESFFLAETTKYLYLLFSDDHWLLSSGSQGRPMNVNGRLCVVEAGGYFFNTEAHPIDTGALSCCSGPKLSDAFLTKEDMAKYIMNPSKIPKRNKRLVLKPKEEQKVEKGQHEESEKAEAPNKYDGTLVELSLEQMSSKNMFKYKYDNQEQVSSTVPVETIVDVSLPHLTDSVLLKTTVLQDPKEEEKSEDEDSSSDEMETNFESKNTDSDETKREEKSTTEDYYIIDQSEMIDDENVNNEKKDKFETITTENDTKNKYDNDNNIVGLKEAEKSDGVSWNNLATSSSGRIDSTSTSTSSASFASGIPEISGISTSVSSSKSISRTSDNRIVDILPVTSPKPKIIFSLESFKQKLSQDMAILKNATAGVTYAVLSCPVESFAQSLSFKGLMIDTNYSNG